MDTIKFIVGDVVVCEHHNEDENSPVYTGLVYKPCAKCYRSFDRAECPGCNRPNALAKTLNRSNERVLHCVYIDCACHINERRMDVLIREFDY